VWWNPSSCSGSDAGSLVGWGLVYDYGAVGLMHVMEEHRRRGLARWIAIVLLKKWISADQFKGPPFCYIVDSNVASINLFKSLGFINKADVSWVGLKKYKQTKEAL
jgi:L-amino acid N-acyltransferase YncA